MDALYLSRLVNACRDFLQAYEARKSPVNRMLGDDVERALDKVVDDSAAALGGCFHTVPNCVVCGFSTSAECGECGGAVCFSCQWEHSDDNCHEHHCQKCCTNRDDKS